MNSRIARSKAAIAVLALLFAGHACGQAKLDSLHSFTGPDGMFPTAKLLQASDGNFYGTTYTSGPKGGGTVFRFTPAGVLTTLYSFGDNTTALDGSLPVGALIQASDGHLYGGTSLYGDTGSGVADGRGTVFRITLGGVFTNLHTFRAPEGQQPFAALLQAADGNLYGTTVQGGTGGTGSIFKMTTGGALTMLYNFRQDAADGAQLQAPLIQGPDGNFYGAAYQGGYGAIPNGGGGVIFKMTPTGTLTALHYFQYAGDPNGWNPNGGLTLGADGNFYGVTGRSMYKITPQGAFTLLSSSSHTPSGELLRASDGNFYGTTQTGGTPLNGIPRNYGSIFRMTPAGAVTTLVYFSGADGSIPATGMIQATDGRLYGVTNTGGTNNRGTIFRLTLPPAVPTGLTASGGRNQVTLSWTAASGAASYNIYQATSASGQSTTPVRTDVQTTSTTITGLADGTTYYFKVAGVNVAGAGTLSSEASATTLAAEGKGGGGALGLGCLAFLAGYALFSKQFFKRRLQRRAA